jgi:hypothetical protein
MQMLHSTLTIRVSRLILAGLAVLIVGGAAASFWHRLHYPMKPLYVELYNETETVIPSVVIEHGNANTQEKIMALQLGAKERRIVVLNHYPEAGFSITANYANGKNSEICAGKWSKGWFLRETIGQFGIYTTEIR